MLNPFTYWWKQLAGPQVTAVMQGIFYFFYDMLASKTEYFRTVSIATANDDHCTLFGVLMNMARPILTEEKVKNFWFTDGPSRSEEPGEYHGFADLTGAAVAGFQGGKFTDLNDNSELQEEIYLPIKYWRQMLTLVSTSDGNPGSLRLVDDLILWFYTTYRPSIDPDYILDIDEFGDEARAIGDINLHIGKLTYWMEYAPFLYASLETVAQSFYNPQPMFHIIFNYASNVWEQITLEELTLMWAGHAEIEEDTGIGFEAFTSTNLQEMWDGTYTVPADTPMDGYDPMTPAEIAAMW